MTDSTNLPQYEDRYVAFIDILGFSALVRRTESDQDLLRRIVSSLTEVREYAKLGPAMSASAKNVPGEFFNNLFQMSTFSDSIVMSTKVNAMGLGLLSTLSAIMCARLLHQGAFTRGGISRGKLIHREDLVIGGGLISAHHLENSAAVYPRILLADDLAKDFDALAKQGGSPDFRRRDFDGLWHLHILHPSLLNMIQATTRSDQNPLQAGFMALGRTEIIEALRINQEPAILAKLGWLARYFNAYAASHGVEPIPVDGA
jgi:hypothetical protein